MNHPIIHIELSADDHKRAAKWYQDMFNWSITQHPGVDYSTFKAGTDGLDGGFNNVGPDYQAGWVVLYIQTHDLKAHVAKIAANGGTILIPYQAVPGVGAVALFKDPTGNVVGLLQPGIA